jgi:hypothetical protein
MANPISCFPEHRGDNYPSMRSRRMPKCGKRISNRSHGEHPGKNRIESRRGSLKQEHCPDKPADEGHEEQTPERNTSDRGQSTPVGDGGREPPGNSATALEAFSSIESSPAPIRAGKVTNEPPPARAFIAPANKPAPASVHSWLSATRA